MCVRAGLCTAAAVVDIARDVFRFLNGFEAQFLFSYHNACTERVVRDFGSPFCSGHLYLCDAICGILRMDTMGPDAPKCCGRVRIYFPASREREKSMGCLLSAFLYFSSTPPLRR